MKALVLSAAILALAAVTWAEEVKPDSAKGPEIPVLRRLPPLDASKLDAPARFHSGTWWDAQELSDETNGIYVRVRTIPWEPGQIRPAGYDRYRNIRVENGIRWLEQQDAAGRKAVSLRFRLIPETVHYLVTTPEAPLFPRRIAVREIGEVEGFSPVQRLEMIELASRDKKAPIRLMAVSAAGNHKPLAEVVPVLCRALNDPDDLVASEACVPLGRYFGVPAAFHTSSGSFSYEITGTPTEETNRWCMKPGRLEALIMARAIHDRQPGLVTAADVAAIDAMGDAPSRWAEEKSQSKPESPPVKKPDSTIPKAESK